MSSDYVSELVDAKEVARVLGVSKWQVYELAKKDGLPIKTIRVGQRYRFSRSELQRLIDGGLSETGVVINGG